jgi:hypothetical protein
MTKTTSTKPNSKARRAARKAETTEQTAVRDEAIEAVIAAAPDAGAGIDAAIEVVKAATGGGKTAKVLPTLTEALETARKENPIRYEHVTAVASLTKDGKPARVVILCADPQTKQGADGKAISVCEGTREIAVQDLFQVRCCAACADRKVRKARRERTKARNKAARKLLAARGK